MLYMYNLQVPALEETEVLAQAGLFIFERVVFHINFKYTAPDLVLFNTT